MNNTSKTDTSSKNLNISSDQVKGMFDDDEDEYTNFTNSSG